MESHIVIHSSYKYFTSQRCTSNLALPQWRTTYYWTDTVKFLNRRVRAKLPTEVKLQVA